MTLIDQSRNRTKVINNLVFSICLFLILEIVIMVTSKKISKWISKPVIDAFAKQKEFIADASHELKTPLAVIMASSDSLVGKKEDKKLIDNIKNESERMSNLINRLLELAKMEDGRISDNFTNNNLSKIVNMAMLTFEPLAFEKKAKIEGNVEKDIELMSDNESIKELLSILIDNSIKHCEEGSSITVNLTKIKNDIVLEVINKGEAIKEGDEERIFDRFYRASEDRNRKENRYGLGLAIAKGIVKMHNGEIKAKSKDGYTTFTVKF
jgi:signal transduction histidine kinase